MILKTHHLTELFRQTDPIEGAILSRIRTASQTQKDLDYINRNVTPIPPKNATVLTFYRAAAKSLNEKALESLNGDRLYFECDRTGTYKEKNKLGKYKTQGPYLEMLEMKFGCRLIIKSNGKCKVDKIDVVYSNGDAGRLMGIDAHDRLQVLRDDGQMLLIARKKTGDVTDKKVMEMQEEEDELGNIIEVERPVLKQVTKGQFVQYPVTLGYAQTGHSSQGLTLDRVHIVLPKEKPRSPNWIYVVMSRVRSMKNLSFNRPLTMNDVWVIDDLIKLGNQQGELGI